MISLRKVFFIFLCFYISTVSADGEFLNLLYTGDILEVPIKTGIETRIIVDFINEAEIGYAPTIASKQVSTKILPTGIFIHSNNPFDGDYAEIISKSRDRVIPIRFISNDTAHNPARKIRIVDSTFKKPISVEKIDNKKVATAYVRQKVPQSGTGGQPKNDISLLIQRAAQDVFGAKRSIYALRGLESIPLNKEKIFFRAGHLKGNVIRMYKYKNLYLSTVLLKNKTNKTHFIDPRKFYGHWLYAAFQDGNVIKANQKGVIYLVSSVPFKDASRRVVNWRKLDE